MHPRTRGLVSLAAVAVMVFALIPGAGAAPADPFKGGWRSVDAFDDSDQRLTFGGSGETRRVKLIDNDATAACDTGGLVRGSGLGVVDGDSIEVTYELTCADGTPPFEATVTYDYDAATNTLSDTVGGLTTTWHRPGGGS
jgi:hypothetical protein